MENRKLRKGEQKSLKKHEKNGGEKKLSEMRRKK